MPEVVRMPENPCPFCKRNEVTQLCDFVVDYISTSHPKHFGRMTLTCDNPICKECATSFSGHDFCPSCAPLYEYVQKNHKKVRSLKG